MYFRHRAAAGAPRRFATRVLPTLLASLLACVLVTPALADDAADVLTLMKSARHAEALSRAEAAIAAKPRDAQLRFMKGVILSEMNRPAEAIAIFTRLTEEQPQLPEPWNNLAVLYAAQGQVDKARAALEKAIRTNPSYATAYDNLGDIHARLAGMAYDRALQIDSGNANARSRLTLVKSLGQSNNAPPRTVEASPAPRPQAVPQPLPQASPQPLPQIAQAPAASNPAAPRAVPPPVAAKPAPAPTPAPMPAATPAPTAQKPAQTAATKPPTGAAASPAHPSTPQVQASSSPRPEADSKAHAAARAAGAEREAVLAAVQAWARDWSERDVKGYLSHYASDFETPGRQSRKAWAEERQARITGKGRIQVRVEAPQVSVDNGRATVRFRQQYNSDRLTVSSRKTLVLVRQKGRWLIQKESTGS